MYNIWVTGAGNPISTDVRRVLGVMHTCGWTREQVKKNLMLPAMEIERIFDAIDAENHKVIRRMVEEGLTLDDAVEIFAKETAICRTCHAFLSLVPCVTCSLEGTEDEPWDNEEDLPESDEATDSLPGSLERLMVMRERAERGLSVFCKNDRPYNLQLPWCA